MQKFLKEIKQVITGMQATNYLVYNLDKLQIFYENVLNTLDVFIIRKIKKYFCCSTLNPV